MYASRNVIRSNAAKAAVDINRKESSKSLDSSVGSDCFMLRYISPATISCAAMRKVVLPVSGCNHFTGIPAPTIRTSCIGLAIAWPCPSTCSSEISTEYVETVPYLWLGRMNITSEDAILCTILCVHIKIYYGSCVIGECSSVRSHL